MMTNKLNRRTLLKTAGVATSLSSIGLARAISLDGKKAFNWDKDADVVILGYGNAGTNAAIAAFDAGASVIILEKLSVGGGNVAVSSGGYVVPTDRNKYYAYLKSLFELSRSEWDEEVLSVFCDESLKLNEYFRSLEPEVKTTVYGHAGYQTLPGSESVDKISLRNVPGAKGGDRLFQTLARACETRKIPILLNTPARRLIHRDGEVVGVEAISNGRPLMIRANKAVVICTGGFQCNPDLMRRYIFGNPMSFLGSPGHTGDGLLMAQSMGCDLWHMNAVSAPLGINVPGVKAGIALVTRQPSFIWVDQDGRRFVNEKKLDYHCSWMAVNIFDAIQHRYPRIPCWMIMDENYIKAGPIVSKGASGYAINREGYEWSDDNSKEIASGVIIKAEDLSELAKKLGMRDPATLVETVQRWNSDLASKGYDTEFGRTLTADPNMRAVFIGRDVQAWSAQLAETGPYYAVKLVPVLYHTMGGPKHSAKSECLDPYGKPIRRLYVAGEVSSIWGITYQGATANSDAIIFGRIAGRNAAALKPWL